MLMWPVSAARTASRRLLGLHDAIAVIAAAEAEHTPFPAAGPSRHLDGEPVEYVGVEFSPAMAIRISLQNQPSDRPSRNRSTRSPVRAWLSVPRARVP